MGKDSENHVSKLNNDEVYDASFGTYVWNPKTGQVFGRTGLSWAKLTIFYFVFYSGLASFTGLYYYLFSQTLTAERPKWILGESLIGTNPGMGYRPMPNPENNAESTLIWYRHNESSDAKFWYQQLNSYIDGLDAQRDNDDVVNCSYNGTKATKNRCCRIDLNTMVPKECSKSNNFGYTAGDPCILLKLNKIFGWEPQGYGIVNNEYDHNQLVKDLDAAVKDQKMPEQMKKHILEGVLSRPSEAVGFLGTIWITCEGEGVADKESIATINYLPQHGIPGYYFPYYKQKGYQSPFMFVQLMRPINGILINVECKAWAKNIIHDRINRLGSVHFELMID